MKHTGLKSRKRAIISNILDIRQDIVMNIDRYERKRALSIYEQKIFSRNIRVFFLWKSSFARSVIIR